MSWPKRECLAISGSKVGVDQKWVRVGGRGVAKLNQYLGIGESTVVLKPRICLSQNFLSCKI